ncbi:hypothetical protein B0H13DRAFT_1851186 [Mycena leptocephala]|nr:hypothetical protein B0H13DRAFT_1851186 [Mycena leptocephala]
MFCKNICTLSWPGRAERAELAEAERVEKAAKEGVPDQLQTTDEESTPRLPNRLPAWKPMTLQILFGGVEKPRTRKPSVRVILMEALAEEVEDAFPNDGAIEINSDEEV